MAWAVTGVDDAVKLWTAKLWKQLNDEIWFKNWTGEDANNIIQRRTDLTKQKGDKVIFELLPRLTAAGVTSDAALEGNEEDMTFYGDSVTIDQYRHAVKWPGKYWVQKVPFNVRRAMSDALGIWLAEKYDGLHFSALSSSPSHVLTVGGGQTANHLTAASNELTLSTIRKLPFLAKAQRMRPVVRGGRKYYVFLMHDQAALALQQKYSTSAQTWYETMLHARDRDKDNPLFSGALGMVGAGGISVLLHNHDNANLKGATTAGTNETYNLLLGAQAGVVSIAQRPTWVEKEFEYDNELGIATGFMAGVKKSEFNGDDYGVYQIASYAPAIA